MPVFLSGLVRFQRRGNFFKLHKPRFVRGFLLVFDWNKGVLKAGIFDWPHNCHTLLETTYYSHERDIAGKFNCIAFFSM